MLKRNNEVIAESLAAMISPATQALARQINETAALALEPLLAQQKIISQQVLAATGIAETARRVSEDVLRSLGPVLEHVHQINEAQLAMMHATLRSAAASAVAETQPDPTGLDQSLEESPFKAVDWGLALALLPGMLQAMHGRVPGDETLKDVLVVVLLYTLVLLVRDVRQRGWAPNA